MKKITVLLLSFCVLFTGLLVNPSNSSAASTWVDLGGGYKARLDGVHGTANPKYHVHVQKNGKDIGAENMDGTKSHGMTLKNVPEKVKKKLKAHPEYKKHKKKHDNLESQKQKAKKINWTNPVQVSMALTQVAIAAGIAFGTFTIGVWKKIVMA
ncbi:hypothetical protein [Bacillus cereus group sp. BfR-BA-01518]|uniref:hypothetical protein n=1 Tax=Bacillus cereus group sp. BfR-BA-01518 TaxID=2920368 RepID=UPI001F5A7E8A|nr:hypothetical protein [Bacillus cereus group sp. BfR-BA-01518]